MSVVPPTSRANVHRRRFGVARRTPRSAGAGASRSRRGGDTHHLESDREERETSEPLHHVLRGGWEGRVLVRLGGELIAWRVRGALGKIAARRASEGERRTGGRSDVTVAKLSDAKGVKRAFTIAPVLPGREGALAGSTQRDAEVRRRLSRCAANARCRPSIRTTVRTEPLKSTSQEPSFRQNPKPG